MNGEVLPCPLCGWRLPTAGAGNCIQHVVRDHYETPLAKNILRTIINNMLPGPDGDRIGEDSTEGRDS